MRKLRIAKAKKILGYGVSLALMLFFTYSIVMYSLAFKVSAIQWSISNLWMMTFSFSALQDLIIWTNVKVMTRICVLYIFYKFF